MWQAYGGFTWAFAPYTAVNFTTYVDTPELKEFLIAIDPITYFDRLKDIPKFITIAADDEFMMMDWIKMYWSKL
jgi:PhoPQ-activated pathogenicity-related protein